MNCVRRNDNLQRVGDVLVQCKKIIVAAPLASVTITIGTVTIDDQHLACSRPEPNTWNTRPIITAICVGSCEVQDARPVRIDTILVVAIAATVSWCDVDANLVVECHINGREVRALCRLCQLAIATKRLPGDRRDRVDLRIRKLGCGSDG